MKARGVVIVGLAVAGILLAGAQALGQVRVLFVDETQTFETSMRLEVLARRLKASGTFAISAQLSIPATPWESEAYDFAVILAGELPFIWICSPGMSAVLPVSLQQAKAVLTEAVTGAFQGIRDVLGVEDDLAALLWSAYFLQLGVLQNVDAPSAE